MEYLFILGRNLKLSQQEVLSYLKRTKNNVQNSELNSNALLVEVSEAVNEKAIDFLGGVISIGNIISEANSTEELEQNLEDKMIYKGTANKLNYVLWNFADSKIYDSIALYIKKRFSQEKLKATKKLLGSFMKTQSEKDISLISNAATIDEQYFVFSSKEKIYFGEIIQECNYEKIEKRDMEKPVRRSSLSISPRLVKIMINLSEIKDKEMLLDGFCGIGIVLQEALLQGLYVVGVDRDNSAISGAKQNLEWFNFDKTKYKLINFDSSRVQIPQADVLVSEPDFGETLKKQTTPEKAKKMISRYENIMIKVLKNLNKKVKGKIVFTAPLIKTPKKRLGADLEKIASAINRKIAPEFPIPEFRKDQIVGREIVVLE
jgi:tRNA G10  N-methylase Trm11